MKLNDSAALDRILSIDIFRHPTVMVVNAVLIPPDMAGFTKHGPNFFG